MVNGLLNVMVYAHAGQARPEMPFIWPEINDNSIGLSKNFREFWVLSCVVSPTYDARSAWCIFTIPNCDLRCSMVIFVMINIYIVDSSTEHNYDTLFRTIPIQLNHFIGLLSFYYPLDSLLRLHHDAL